MTWGYTFTWYPNLSETSTCGCDGCESSAEAQAHTLMQAFRYGYTVPRWWQWWRWREQSVPWKEIVEWMGNRIEPKQEDEE